MQLEDLCRDCPELLPELRSRVEQLKATDWLFENPPDKQLPVETVHVTWRAQVGDYEVLELLGVGGMGTVYKARHTRLDKVVALKLLPDRVSQDRDAVTRFEREMRAVGKLEHPQIVTAYDAGESQGAYYLAMQLIEGTDLKRVLDCAGPLKVAEACEIVRQACLGVQHAHENHLVHRDIKPSNLMLDFEGRVKLLDWDWLELMMSRRRIRNSHRSIRWSGRSISCRPSNTSRRFTRMPAPTFTALA